MNKIIKIYLIVFGIFFLSITNVLADGFVINLYYDAATKNLIFDKNASKSVLRDQNAKTSIVQFSNDDTIGPFILKLYDAQGIELSANQFNKKDGAFQLTIPYFSLATQLKIFEKSTSKELLVVDLNEFSTCNGNGKCEPNLGETDLNCMGDCKPSVVKNVSDNGSAFLTSNNSNTTNAVTTNTEELSWWQKIVLFFKNLWNSIMGVA